ncbi:hypothetical protein GCM10010254_20940 [Streptomyces chromofuscus]|uniref:OsmC family protein n=1 Tax=Streptomyces chromofuscus TaxID=42881 RepID=UPI0019CEF1A4|nr:hypothetical protein GCM10010254_20940 [Streptomyces chromofuscus]
MPARAAVGESSPPAQAQVITIGPHALTADEPAPVGQDTGPTPVDLLPAALGACTSVTVRMYAKRHGRPLTGVEVDVRLDRTQGRAATSSRTSACPANWGLSRSHA